MIFGLVSSAILSLAAGQALDATAGVRLESSSGKVPVVPDLPSRDITRFEATPAIGVILTDHAYRTSLTYSPVIYFRLPNDLDRPLVLHDLALTHRHQLARTRTLDVRVEGSRGEVDYGRAGLLVGTEFEVANLVPQSNLIKSTNLSGTAVLTELLSRTESLRFEGAATYARPQSVDTAFFGQFRAGLESSFVTLFTRSDELTISAGFEWIEFLASDMTTAANRNLALVNSEVRLRRFDGRGFEVSAGAGVSVAANTSEVVPVIDLGLAAPIIGKGAALLTTELNAGIRGFANPTSGQYDPRAFASGAVIFSVRPRLTVSINGSFATPLTGEDGAAVGAAARAQTVLAGRLPIAYRFTEEVSAELGVRASTRAPRLNAPNFEFGQFELVGYGTLNVVFGTHNANRGPRI